MTLTAVSFVIAILTGWALALLRHPIFGVVTYILLVFVNPPGRWWAHGFLGDIRWSLLTAVITAMALLVHRDRPPVYPFFRQPLFWGVVTLLVWVGIQTGWALAPDLHKELFSYYWKILIAIVLIYLSIDRQKHLGYVLWAFVAGCTYLGWVGYWLYHGGRFDDFGGSGLSDANAVAMTLVTGTLVGGSLFLSSGAWGRAALLVMLPMILNALVMTVSRSGFLSLAVGGVVFNILAPKRLRGRILMLSLIGVLAFFLVTNESYWGRVDTVLYRGAEIEGLDTGYKRLVLLEAQMKMSQRYPFGCGARCTDILSPEYLAESQLNEGTRSSHNTMMTMLVDHGMPGIFVYLLMLFWVISAVVKLRNGTAAPGTYLSLLLPSIGGALAAITVADMFVQYPKLEVRFWFLTILAIMVGWQKQAAAGATSTN